MADAWSWPGCDRNYVGSFLPTHYWRIVAHLGGGRTEVFWGNDNSLRDAARKLAAVEEAARKRGWERYDFEVVELIEGKG